jgi:hypothetical protein
MFDSVSATEIPREAALVAGYGDGAYKWTPQDWALFPPARCVVIATTAGFFTAIVLDVEAGDATPEQAPLWIVGAKRATGWVPTLYGTKATLDRCRLIVANAGLDCDFWLADWTGIPHLAAGYAACQYAAPGHGAGGHFDQSVVAAWWPRTVGTPRPL